MQLTVRLGGAGGQGDTLSTFANLAEDLRTRPEAESGMQAAITVAEGLRRSLRNHQMNSCGSLSMR